MSRALKTRQSIDSKVLSRLMSKGAGSVFVPGDFLDLGSRQAIDLVLHRLVKKGIIRRLARGVYDYPERHPALGLCRLPPIRSRRHWRDVTAHACSLRAITRQTRWACPSKCPRKRCS